MSESQREKAVHFRALHESGTFIIPNPWDGASARMLEALGFKALATSSGAQAAALGRRDGKVSREEALAHCANIVRAVDLPVSADLEKGFGDAPADAAETIHQAAGVGLVGGSIEDATGSRETPLYSIDAATARVAAAVEAARKLDFPFTLTARTESFLRNNPDLDDVIRRLREFEKAGADVLMAPGLPDLESVRAVCAAVSQPVNFMNGIPHRSFSAADLSAAGVRRVSTATSLYRAAFGGFLAAAKELAEHGTFGYIDATTGGAELNAALLG
jgi:2-methylisocitrate lyase-like PEP mutase family enzyme